MTALLQYEQEEFCPSCGTWVPVQYFNQDEGWCLACAPLHSQHGKCTCCGGSVTHRTMCKACREEAWLTKHADELEYLVVTKGYTIAQARQAVTKMVRPICHCCKKVIKNGAPSDLFCKQNKKCHSAYNKYRRLITKSGLRPDVALATIVSRNSNREVESRGKLVRVSGASG